MPYIEHATYKGYSIALDSDGLLSVEVYGAIYRREKLKEIKDLIDDLIKTRRN
jgi:hypothetical protein